ncbi:Crp/Fnr family transcriptional regulator [Rhodoferax sp.]|uniref:Crp/Fnr family transcriptional regulator n=1 Tax=Rhodoferax sp. TaxID=50421 RepID=UPI0027529076|nr:Crp/Fnr family transcriptional regulator [Rhodoferax sp.]
MFPAPANPIARFLTTLAWFNALPAQAQQALQTAVFTLRARKGTTVLPANEPVQGWYAVLSGLVKIESSVGAGRCSTFLGLASGEWFGEGAVLKNEPRRYNVIALRDTELLCLPNEQFRSLSAGCMAFNQFLVERLNHKLGQAMAIIEAGRTRNPEQRVALSLSRLFWSRTRQLDLTQDEVASIAGMSRQTANRALNNLQQLGVISLSMNRITVLDDTALTDVMLSRDRDQA